MRSDSLAFRLVAGAALWSAIALVAGGLILSAIFRNSVERSFDSRFVEFSDDPETRRARLDDEREALAAIYGDDYEENDYPP